MGFVLMLMLMLMLILMLMLGGWRDGVLTGGGRRLANEATALPCSSAASTLR